MRYKIVDSYRDNDRTTKMDAALFFAEAATTASWADVAIVIECKLRNNRDQAEAKNQLKRAAELVQFRLFVWGLSVYSHGLEKHRKYKFQLIFVGHVVQLDIIPTPMFSRVSYNERRMASRLWRPIQGVIIFLCFLDRPSLFSCSPYGGPCFLDSPV